MDKISTTVAPQVPTAVEDLQKFVLIGREKLVAVRAEIRAINKISLAKEVMEQKKVEAQMLAGALLEAEARIGEITKAIPKAGGGNRRSDDFKSNTAVTFEKPKEEVIKDMGFTKMQVSRFETLADNRDIIEQVKQEAEENDELPTRSEVLRRVAEEKQAPHVSNNSGNNEWYTPPEYIETARLVMGSIDCDPASSEIANKTVKAGIYYTADDDGLKQDWKGNVWMNPPYSQPLIQQFCEKLVEEIDNGNTTQACVLVNNATETNWFQNMASRSDAIWFIRGRVKFLDIRGFPGGAPLQGQCLLYFGPEAARFLETCHGLVCRCSHV